MSVVNKQKDSNLLKFGGTERGISPQTIFTTLCAADDLSSRGCRLTPLCQAGVERLSWIKRLTFPSTQVIPYVQPTKMNAPVCIPEYKISEWKGDKATNSPQRSLLKEVVCCIVRACGNTINCVDERPLDSLSLNQL